MVRLSIRIAFTDDKRGHWLKLPLGQDELLYAADFCALRLAKACLEAENMEVGKLSCQELLPPHCQWIGENIQSKCQPDPFWCS